MGAHTPETEPEPWDTVRALRALNAASAILKDIRANVPNLRSEDEHGVDPALRHLHACATLMYASYGHDLWKQAGALAVDIQAEGSGV